MTSTLYRVPGWVNGLVRADSVLPKDRSARISSAAEDQVDPDRQQDNEAFDDLQVERRDVHQDEAVCNTGEEQRADHGAEHLSLIHI